MPVERLARTEGIDETYSMVEVIQHLYHDRITDGTSMYPVPTEQAFTEDVTITTTIDQASTRIVETTTNLLDANATRSSR